MTQLFRRAGDGGLTNASLLVAAFLLGFNASCFAPGGVSSTEFWSAPRSVGECLERKTPGRVETFPEGTPITLQMQNEMGADYVFRDICVVVNRRVVYAEDDASPLAHGHSLDVPTGLPREGPAVAYLMVNYRGAAPYAGYNFLVRSRHDISQADIAAGVLSIRMVEKMPRPNTPLEQRPTIIWSASSSAPRQPAQLP